MSTKDEDNFLRILYLYNNVAAPALRNYFDRLHPDLASVLSSNKSIISDLYKPPRHRKKILYHAQWNTLYPPSGLAVTSADLDVTLMVCLLRNLPPTVLPPVGGFDVLPRSSDISDGANIARIKIYKNLIVSSKDGKLSDSHFESIWSDLEKVIYGFGNQQDVENVADAKTKVLVYESTKRFTNLDDIKLETGDTEKNRKRLSDHADEQAEQPNKMAKQETGKKIPEQITKMDEESINIYLKALEKGSETRRDINLVIVGQRGAGKTSLVHRLLGENVENIGENVENIGENVENITSTNGIEIHRRRCQISLNNWEWNKIPDTNAMKESSFNNRLLQSMVKELHQERENETSSLDMLGSNKDEENKCITATGQVTKQQHDLQFSVDEQLTTSESKTASHSSDLALQMLSSIIRPDLVLQDEDSHASLTVWDFAGDKEFYNTHQTFLNPEAIYLVVANLADINSTESHGTFNFWMDTIHCYGSISEKPSEVYGTLDPAVIAVGTHKDKFEDKEQCKELLASYINEIFTDSKLHLRSTHLISNTDDQEDVFRELRNDIFETAKKSANWNREYPVKFIQIEKAVNSELMNGKRIIPLERIKELGSNTSMPISDDKELLVFLKYQHEVGNLLFFEDIPKYIILDPQWLANAFKCIVTAEQFQLKLPNLDWSELKKTGKMDSKLLDEIFRKQSLDISNHKEHILEVIEKFDIIICPSLRKDNGSVQKESCFYIPCMIQISKIEDIDHMFKVPVDSKSTCLCFVFRFLPPHLFSSLIVSCLREYSIASVSGQIGLFKDCCVFDISETGCSKFLLAKGKHMIELQVWQWGIANLLQNQDVLQFVEMEINRIVDTRYKLKTVFAEKKWKCETTSYSFEKGFHKLDKVHDGGDYYCEEHGTKHIYEDHWSGEKSKAPMIMSSEQQNYVRMSMIVLDVLSGVLYDRLQIDTNTGEILDRDKLDITEMCKKYCALKTNFPSKGYRNIGKVDEISINEDNIGDDIQRIRVIRNEMQHSTVFALEDTRYQTLITIVHDMLTRFDLRNNPAGESYVKRLDKIREMELKTGNFEETKERMKAELTELGERLLEVAGALKDIC